MNKDWIIKELSTSLEFLNNSIACLTDEHSDFKPTDESLTTAQQLAHIGQRVSWFLEGAFSESGFDMDFESHWKDIEHISTVSEAKAHIEKAFAEVIEAAKSKDISEWNQAFAEGPIMGGEPRINIVTGIIDHTAHHRGALAVYARLQGLTPKMPYGE